MGKVLGYELREKIKDQIVRHRAARISWRDSCAELKINQKTYYALLDEIAGEQLGELKASRDRFIHKFFSSQEALLQVAEGLVLKAETPEAKLKAAEAKAHMECALVDRLIKMGFLPSEPDSSVVVNNAVVVKGPIQAQVEAFRQIVRANRAQRGSSDAGDAQG